MDYKNQKGISLIVVFFVLMIIITAVLGLSAILLNNIKSASIAGNSIQAFYTAETGVEQMFYFDRNPAPGDSRGIGNVCNVCFADPVSPCSSCSATPVSDGGCDSPNYANCQVTWTSPFANTYTVSVVTDSVNQWSGIGYGNGLFTAVGNNTYDYTHHIISSSDAVNWSLHNSTDSFRTSNIAYGNGVWVLAGNGPTLTSTDTITWANQGPNPLWGFHNNTLAYGAGLFIAIAYGASDTGQVMTSDNGTSWMVRYLPERNYWTGLTYGLANGTTPTFVAIADQSGDPTKVATSQDGINWTINPGAPNHPWEAIGYGNGLFVAVSIDDGTQKVMTSPDGVSWTMRTTPFSTQNWKAIAYGNGTFVAVADSSDGAPDLQRVMTSSDNGITWTLRNASAANNWVSITYGNGLFVAVADGGNTNERIMTSPDGITWTAGGGNIGYSDIINSTGIYNNATRRIDVTSPLLGGGSGGSGSVGVCNMVGECVGNGTVCGACGLGNNGLQCICTNSI